MNFGRLAAVAATVLSISAGHVQAAEEVASIVSATGKVLVNKGEGFVVALAGTGLVAGDKVMIGKNASASISYPNCTLSLDRATVFTVGPEATCETSAQGLNIVPTAVAGAAPGAAIFVVGGVAAASAGAFLATTLQKDCPVSGAC